MVRYTVLWRRELEGELAALWCDSPNRQDISMAADRIDAELRIDAHLKGTRFPNGVMALAIAPLVAYFRVDEADRKVFIESIVLTDDN